VATHEQEESPQVGGTGGEASPSAPDDVAAGDDELVGPGGIQIPLGVPLSEEEFRRLKEAARHPVRGGAGEVTEQEQEEQDRDDRAEPE
jgi:hypothetical protein